jgi:DNA-directed RNA polymerase subunit L
MMTGAEMEDIGLSTGEIEGPDPDAMVKVVATDDTMEEVEAGGDSRVKPKVLEHDRYELRIEFQGEDHGFCNLLRRTLLEEPAVESAGYHLEHPLLASPVVTLKTKKRMATVVLREALEKILARTEEFRKGFNQTLSDHSIG